MSSTFKFRIEVPEEVTLPESQDSFPRECFFQWLWESFADYGLVGVHEGTILSEQAAEMGFETDSWTLDSAEAPADRDWIDRQSNAEAEVFFSSAELADRAIRILKGIPNLSIGLVEEQKEQDWDAEWKASFLNHGEGVTIPPFWRIVPPWVDQNDKSPNEKWIKINPGAGFGTGTHETTQLCLEAAGVWKEKNPSHLSNALDFGSGSGILSIGLAMLGARVDSVEIDELALANAAENSEMNDQVDRIFLSRYLPEEVKTYDVVVANILRPILLQFCTKLVTRTSLVKTGAGALILSGLIETDVKEVRDTFLIEFKKYGKTPFVQVLEKAEWRALVFQVV